MQQGREPQSKLTLEDFMRNSHMPWSWKWIWCWQMQVHQVKVEDIVSRRFPTDPPNDIIMLCSYDELVKAVDNIENENISLYLLDNTSVPLRLLTDKKMLHPYILWDIVFAKYPISEIIENKENIPNFHPSLVSNNINATLEDVQQHPDVPWSGYVLSRTLMDFSEIRKNTGIRWNFMVLSANPNMTLDFLLSNADLIWYPVYVSQYLSGVTFELAESTKFEWDWKFLSSNPSVLEVTDEELSAEFRKISAINKIKRQFKESYTCPSYVLCNTRLLREFDQCLQTI
jgi:hypothetical protein